MRHISLILLIIFIFSPLTLMAENSRNAAFLSDSQTGYALYGYDTVAYFTDKASIKGAREYEVFWNGLSWLFINPGNREAFLRNPRIYAPQLGGFGAVGLARGKITEGNALHWVIYDGKLYFFHSAISRLIWLDNPEKNIARAQKNWDKLGQKVPRF